MSEYGVTEDLVRAATQVLVEAARERRELTYTEFAEQLPGVARRGPKTAHLLGEVCRQAFVDHGVLLTVLVFSAVDRLPSHGFFDLLEELRPDNLEADRVTLARRERNKVYDASRAWRNTSTLRSTRPHDKRRKTTRVNNSRDVSSSLRSMLTRGVLDHPLLLSSCLGSGVITPSLV